MGREIPSNPKEVRRGLAAFAVLAVAGVIAMAYSVILGLALLAVAEVFFLVSFRRARRPPARS